MSSLRDHVRKALDDEALTAREAAADLDAVVARTKGRRSLRGPGFALAFAAVAAGGAYFALNVAPPRPRPPTEIFVHVVGEPLTDDLALSIIESNVASSTLARIPQGEP